MDTHPPIDATIQHPRPNLTIQLPTAHHLPPMPCTLPAPTRVAHRHSTRVANHTPTARATAHYHPLLEHKNRAGPNLIEPHRPADFAIGCDRIPVRHARDSTQDRRRSRTPGNRELDSPWSSPRSPIPRSAPKQENTEERRASPYTQRKLALTGALGKEERGRAHRDTDSQRATRTDQKVVVDRGEDSRRHALHHGGARQSAPTHIAMIATAMTAVRLLDHASGAYSTTSTTRAAPAPVASASSSSSNGASSSAADSGSVSRPALVSSGAVSSAASSPPGSSV